MALCGPSAAALTWKTVCRVLLPLLCVVVTIEVRRETSWSSMLWGSEGQVERKKNFSHVEGHDGDFHNNSNITDDDVFPDDAETIRHNRNRIRPRPRNLRLVFIGDSLMRYQYISLAYFLKHGMWLDYNFQARDAEAKNLVQNNNLMNSHSFHHPLHPDQDWNEFFWQSTRALYPFEACDCYRHVDSHRNTDRSNGFAVDALVTSNIILERRYFHEPSRNNTIVYINLNGNESTAVTTVDTGAATGGIRGRGEAEVASFDHHYYGHWNPANIFSRFDRYVNRTAQSEHMSSFSSVPSVSLKTCDRNVIDNQTGDHSKEPRSDECRNSSVSLGPTLNPVEGVKTESRFWQLSSWSEVLRYHVADLFPITRSSIDGETSTGPHVLAPNKTHDRDDQVVVVLNAGLHSNSFEEVKSAASTIRDIPGMRGIWKTTTYTLSQVSGKVDSDSSTKARGENIQRTDKAMCEEMECLNISWTLDLEPNLYFDEFHFLEPVHRVFNEDLLKQIGALPDGYTPFNRLETIEPHG